MDFHLKFSDQALSDYRDLENDAGLEKRLKAVRKALVYLEKDPRHPSLHTHEYTSLTRTLVKCFEQRRHRVRIRARQLMQVDKLIRD